MSFTPRLEVAFDVDPATEPGAADWTDLTDKARPVSITYGAGRLAGAGPGTMTVALDDPDHTLEPTNPAATLNLVPMRHARFTVDVGATTYDVWRGFVDAWPPVWSTTDFGRIEVALVDAFAWLALQSEDVDRPREMSHERITALLDAADWPAGLRDISDGVVEVEPYEQNSANLYRTIADTADAEGGDLYVAPDGKITFRSRHGRFGTTATITLADGDVPYGGARIAWDTVRLNNVARFERADGDVFEVTDDASVTAYGPRVTEIRDLPLRDAEAEAVAQWEVVRFAEPHVWANGVTVDAHHDGVLDKVLPLRIGHLTRLIRPVGEETEPILDEAGDPWLDEGGQQILDESSDAQILDDFLTVEKVSHRIGATDWVTTLDLSPHFGAGPWFTWDDPDRGWDMGAKWAP